jgi:hypothetical protein
MASGDEETARMWKELGDRLAAASVESLGAVLSSLRPAFARAGLGDQFAAYEEEIRLLTAEFGSKAKGRAEEAAAAGQDYAKAFASLGRAGAEALRLFWEKGKEVKLDPGRPDETLRALHEAWLGAYNESMRTYFLSDEFGRALSRFLDARASAEKRTREEGEKVLKSFGAPTRGEVDSLHRRLLDLQRRLDRVDPPAKAKGPAGSGSKEGRKRGRRG